MNGIYEVAIPVIPAVVALNPATKEIAFVKQCKETFVDSLFDNELAVWGKDGIMFGEVLHKYQQWYKLNEGSVLFNYFKELLQKDAQSNNPFGF